MPKETKAQFTEDGHEIESHRALIEPAGTTNNRDLVVSNKENNSQQNISAIEDTELDKEAAALMKTCDEELKTQQDEREKSLDYITANLAESRVKGLTKPFSMKLIALFSSLMMGGVGPLLGWLIIKTMVEVSLANFKGIDGLPEVYPYIIALFGMSIVGFFAKSGQ